MEKKGLKKLWSKDQEKQLKDLADEGFFSKEDYESGKRLREAFGFKAKEKVGLVEIFSEEDNEPVHTGYEIGYEEEGALEYFWQSLEDDKEKRDAYFDATKYKIVTHKWKETTDADDEAQGLRDWEWYIEVFKIKPEVSDDI